MVYAICNFIKPCAPCMSMTSGTVHAVMAAMKNDLRAEIYQYLFATLLSIGDLVKNYSRSRVEAILIVYMQSIKV